MDNTEIQTILRYVESKIEYLDYAYKLYDIFNQNLTPYLKTRIRQNFKGKASKEEAVSRLSTINLLPKIINKLSKVYSGVEITYSADGQQDIEAAVKDFKLRKTQNLTNKMLNLGKCCALEPVFPEDLSKDPFVRVLPSHTFLVYSDDPLNPDEPTHFIKFVEAPFEENPEQQVSMNNEVNARVFLQNSTIYIYSMDFFVEIKKGQIGEIQENPYGVLPFVYLKRDTTELMPRSNQDDFEMVTLLPLLLTDSNFALKYKAFSIMYTVNLEAKNMELSPNAIWNFNSTGSDIDKVQIGELKPSLAVDEVLKNLTTQYALWLETKNLKSPTFQGGAMSTQSLSGIAKMIDESDVTDDVATQRDILAEGEEELFHLVENMAPIHRRAYSFGEVTVSFTPSNEMPEIPKERQERILELYDKGFSSKVRTLQDLHNLETKEVAENLYSEIMKEREKEESTNGRVPKPDEIPFQETQEPNSNSFGNAGEGDNQNDNREDEERN